MILSHRTVLKAALALALAAGPGAGPVVRPAAAQSVVYDPSNYAQNVLQAARALQQVNNQIQQIENETQSLINQAKHLVSLPYSLVSSITAQIARTEQLVGQAQRIAYSVTSIDKAFTTNYGAVNLGANQQQMVAQAQARWQNALAGLQDALRMQATVTGNIAAGRAAVTTLGASSQAASGALQAAQVNNQLLVQISQQLSDLIALQAAHGRASSLLAAANVTDQNQAGGPLAGFLAKGSGYQAQSVQMFH